MGAHPRQPLSADEWSRMVEAVRRLVQHLNALARYERRAASRREKAIRAICTDGAWELAREMRKRAKEADWANLFRPRRTYPFRAAVSELTRYDPYRTARRLFGIDQIVSPGAPCGHAKGT